LKAIYQWCHITSNQNHHWLYSTHQREGHPTYISTGAANLNKKVKNTHM
jgi:hypothetical protein